MEEEWQEIIGVPGYILSENGEIRDVRREPSVKVEPENLAGLAVVRLAHPDTLKYFPHVMDELMVDHYIEVIPRSHLYDLIHLDGNPMNCRLDNYGWKRKFLPNEQE